MGRFIRGGAVALATSLCLAAPAAGQGADDPSEFCDINAKVSLLFGRIEEEPTRKQARAIDRLLEQAQEVVPPELAASLDTAVAAVESGDFETEEAAAAVTAIDEYAVASCGYQVVPITGLDYSFEGVPTTPLTTGVTVFPFVNQGAEVHEIVFVRIKGDETLEELLELPEKQVQKKVQFLGGDFAGQGETTYAYVDLKKPGRYAMVCFLPVGSTDFEAIEDAEGPPHALEGMAAEFMVE